MIQNYEIHEQKNFVEIKLSELKNDIEQFLMNYQNSDEEKTLLENRANYVALNFKRLYNKFFLNPIDDELSNYQYYNQKLQELMDKEGITNNFDLIMRNKAEEKLISEKEKVVELIDAKERGFKRIQNENTILITECNRLRKNLHEIYIHVIDIEKRFEILTNIDPKLSKSEIVKRIKEFIKETHEKIKENYLQSRNDLIKPKKKKKDKLNINLGNMSVGKKIKNIYNQNELRKTNNIMEQSVETKKVMNTETNAYILFPDIRKSQSRAQSKKPGQTNKQIYLPTIEK